jgi:hypothetical protein
MKQVVATLGNGNGGPAGLLKLFNPSQKNK